MWPLKSRAADPAPSRWSYRMQRLWLTPIYRRMILIGMPMCFALGAGSMMISDAVLASKVNARLAGFWHEVEERPEFMVKHMQLQGAEGDMARAIRKNLDVEFPISSFKLDLNQLRQQIESMDQVKAAALYLRSGGILETQVELRQPVALLRRSERLEMIDGDGVRCAVIAHRVDFPELPLLVGLGAEAHVGEALALYAAATPFKARVLGLQRVGERRWNLLLDRDQVIKLPAEKPISALKRLVALDAARDLLNRDLLAIDLRITKRPFLRLTPEASEEMFRLRSIAAGEDA